MNEIIDQGTDQNMDWQEISIKGADMKRIYIAGNYSANNIIKCLNNIHDGIKKSVEVLKEGHAPFCPWLDYQFQFFDKTLKVKDYQCYSMAWLEVSDEVWVLPNSKKSKGTQNEIKRAKKLKIPVRYLQETTRQEITNRELTDRFCHDLIY